MIRKILLVGLVCFASHSVFAQVVPASGLSLGGRLQLGIAASGFATDWNRNEYGGTAYVDFDIYRHNLSLEGEARFIFINKDNVNTIIGSVSAVDERNYGIGPRYAFHNGRWVPYIKVLGGVSTISWGHVYSLYPNYTGDSFIYIAPGAGIDVKVSRHVRLRGDYEYQMWLGDDTNKDTIVLTPAGVTAGIGYQF